MSNKCPVCKTESLQYTASANHPSSHKSTTCSSCGFSTGALKPNHVVDAILSSLENGLKETNRFFRNAGAYFKLPDDNEKALRMVMEYSHKGQTPSSVFLNKSGLVDHLHLDEQPPEKLETTVKAWLEKTAQLVT